MVGAAQRGGGDAGHGAAERQMAMAEEDMPDLVAVPADDLAESGIVQQPDLVHRAEMGRHRIVMHEQQKRPVMFRQPPLQPILPRRAIAAGMGLGVRWCRETGSGRPRCRERLARSRPDSAYSGNTLRKAARLIVIADAEPHRKRKAVQPAPQPFIVRPVAPIGEIACDHHQFGVAVVGQDVPERPLEIVAGIAAADGACRARSDGCRSYG